MKASIRPDRVNPVDLKKHNQVFACEDCTYFNFNRKICILGLNTDSHTRETQIKKMEISGQMLLCRFLEIE